MLKKPSTKMTSSTVMKPLLLTLSSSVEAQIRKSAHVLCILFVLLQIGLLTVEARSTLVNPAAPTATVTNANQYQPHQRWSAASYTDVEKYDAPMRRIARAAVASSSTTNSTAAAVWRSVLEPFSPRTLDASDFLL